MTTHMPPETEEELDAYAAILRAGEALDEEARGVIAAALDELRDCRRQAAQERLRQAAVGMHRVIIEGLSDDSAEAAFAAALNKAAHYFSEYHDVGVTLLGLAALPRGGHRATMELHITPMTLRDVAHREAPDLELKHMAEADERTRKRRHEAQAAHMVHDHFLAMTGTTPQFVPDYFMINIKDADLLNHMIEKDFFKATHERRDAEEVPDPQPVPRVRVRVLHPAPDGTFHDTATTGE